MERDLRRSGYPLVAGADEAGRGCLFGPVIAAAVILDPHRPIRGLRDSKALAPAAREELAREIRERAVAWAVAGADAFEIDRLNIYQASRLAMKRAVERLRPPANFLLVDAVLLDVDIPQRAVVHGDALCQVIAAASILAKTERDRLMEAWDRVFPQYRLRRHKGYPTAEHKRAIAEWGPTSLHRFSYGPVRSPGAQQALFAGKEPAGCN
jgi:ribonuclease HII